MNRNLTSCCCWRRGIILYNTHSCYCHIARADSRNTRWDGARHKQQQQQQRERKCTTQRIIQSSFSRSLRDTHETGSGPRQGRVLWWLLRLLDAPQTESAMLAHPLAPGPVRDAVSVIYRCMREEWDTSKPKTEYIIIIHSDVQKPKPNYTLLISRIFCTFHYYTTYYIIWFYYLYIIFYHINLYIFCIYGITINFYTYIKK
jgi:hypothetical protein